MWGGHGEPGKGTVTEPGHTSTGAGGAGVGVTVLPACPRYRKLLGREAPVARGSGPGRGQQIPGPGCMAAAPVASLCAVPGCSQICRINPGVFCKANTGGRGKTNLGSACGVNCSSGLAGSRERAQPWVRSSQVEPLPGVGHRTQRLSLNRLPKLRPPRCAGATSSPSPSLFSGHCRKTGTWVRHCPPSPVLA